MEVLCPKCGDIMVPGRRRDDAHGMKTKQEKWLENSPADHPDNWLSGKGRAYRVVTYACRSSGYLESYLYDKPWHDMNGPQWDPT